MTPQEKKYLVYAGAAFLVVGGLYWYTSTGAESGGSSIDPTGNGGQLPESNTTAFNAKKVADELYEAMRYVGTDKPAITASLRNISQIQFGQVYAAFGTRFYNKTTGNTTEYLFQTIKKENLKTWLYNEVDTEFYNTWKLKYPKYL